MAPAPAKQNGRPQPAAHFWVAPHLHIGARQFIYPPNRAPALGLKLSGPGAPLVVLARAACLYWRPNVKFMRARLLRNVGACAPHKVIKRHEITTMMWRSHAIPIAIR